MGQVKIGRITETFVNKIKQLDPITYESMLDRIKEATEILNAWGATTDETEERILRQMYLRIEGQVISEMLELFKDDSTKRTDICLTKIYQRLLWDK